MQPATAWGTFCSISSRGYEGTTASSRSSMTLPGSSSVAAANEEARVAEIARMLGGERLSPTTLAHAREMLQGVAKLTP